MGAYTFIAGHANIERYAPPFAMVQGMPFRVRGANTELLKRCGFSDSDIQKLRSAFRELFNDQEDHNNPSEVALSEELATNPHVTRLVEFIRRNTAGAQTDA